MTPVAEVFPKLRTPKNMVTSMSKKTPFNWSFGNQHGKRDQILKKFASHHLYHIYWSMWMQLTWKKSLLVIWKTSRLFTNTLSWDSKHSLLNRDNLTLPIQMEVSRKQEIFSRIFPAFLKSDLNFEHFEKKQMSLMAEVFPKFRTPKSQVRSMSKNSRFNWSFAKQHGKHPQTLLKFAWQHLYHIYL